MRQEHQIGLDEARNNQTKTKDTQLLLCANKRLARHCQSRLTSISRIRVMALSSWIHSCWLEGQDRGLEGFNQRLISETEELVIWQELMRHTDEFGTLFARERNLSELISARKRVENTQISIEELASETRPETVFFVKHLLRFRRFCNDKSLRPIEGTYKTLQSAFQHGQLDCEGLIHIHGFIELEPAVEALLNSACNTLETLENDEQSSIHKRLIHPNKSTTHHWQCRNMHIELKQAAEHCGELLSQQAEKTPSIGVIIPYLTDNLAQVEEVFTRTFAHTRFLHPMQQETELPFDISVGSPLAHEPIVLDALALLQLTKTHCLRDDLIRLWESPFWLNGSDTSRIATLQWLMQQSDARLSVGSVLQHFIHLADETSASLLSHFIQFRLQHGSSKEVHRTKTGQKDSLINHIANIKSVLAQLAWPGPRTLNSREYQSVNLFFETLNALPRFSSLRSRFQKMSLSDVIKLLSFQLRKTLFHEQTPSRPIQIMGLMEGLGIGFDHCLMLGLDNQTLPAQPRPSTLLPYQLQKTKRMQRVDHSKELDYARKTMASYLNVNQNVVLSYHQEDKEQTQRYRQSPVLKELFAGTAIESSVFEQAPQQNFDQALVEQIRFQGFDYIDCTKAPPLPPNTAIPGGAQHIKLYSINPVFAFAHFRLGAKPNEDIQLGFDARDRGNLVHDCLARIWAQLQNHVNLTECVATEKLDDLLTELSATTMREYLNRSKRSLPKLHIQLEQDRLKMLCNRWLKKEALRKPFQVQAIEKKYSLKLADWSLQLRVDRVDELAVGNSLVIDYKTGTNRIKQFCHSPLEEPQLPLYVLALGDHVKSVAFASLHTKETRFIGLSDLGDDAPEGVYTVDTHKDSSEFGDWENIKCFWQEELKATAIAIGTGEISNIIRLPNAARFYNHLLPIARLQASATESTAFKTTATRSNKPIFHEGEND